jgi:putative SOS response-associated peptidase YedK
MLQDDDMPVNDAPADEGDGAPRQSYNFAPGYHGVVYRADVSGRGAGAGSGAGTARTHKDASAAQDANTSATTTAEHDSTPKDHEHEQEHEQDHPPPTASQTKDTPAYKLQSMKWGLVPSWTKRNPSYPALLKTINCRDDSLASPGGLWASMKARKRCVVIAQGFYEWLKTGPKEKVPHYVKRKDGKLMLFAGLWDCVHYEDTEDGAAGEGQYTFTVITTDSNAQLKFLHDRMPVVLEPGSEALWRWLDPGRAEWSRELQALLKPFAGELEVYPVSKEVGKVGNNSPAFVIPVASRENKGNIANFFAKGAAAGKKVKPEVEVKKESQEGEETETKTKTKTETETKTVEELEKTADDGGMGTPRKGVKREADSSPTKGEPPAKKGLFAKTASPVKQRPQARGKISATSNAGRSPAKAKAKADGSQKITKFFGNSA